MRRLALPCAILLSCCSCAASPPKTDSQIVAVHVTFRGHLSAVRHCESRGLTPSLEAAEAAGANLAMTFAPARRHPFRHDERRDEGSETAWIPFEGKRSSGTAGVRAFNCPAPFLEEVVRNLKRPAESPK